MESKWSQNFCNKYKNTRVLRRLTNEIKCRDARKFSKMINRATDKDNFQKKINKSVIPQLTKGKWRSSVKNPEKIRKFVKTY